MFEKENRKKVFLVLIIILLFFIIVFFLNNKKIITKENVINDTSIKKETIIEENKGLNQNKNEENNEEITNNIDTQEKNNEAQIENTKDDNTSINSNITNNNVFNPNASSSNIEASKNNTNTQSTSKVETNTNNKTETNSSNNVVKPNIPTNNTTQAESKPVEKTLKEKNQDLINEIKNIYGYRVSYNDESFWYGGVSSTKLTDEELANKALTELKNASSIFPNGFFRTFQGYNGFRIELYQHIEGAAGVASYEFGDDNYLALDVTNGYLGRVFYHETFHIMEQYIRYKTYGTTFPFANWNNLNPSDFRYGSNGYQYTAYDLNQSYSYDNPSSIAFVSEYAKSSDREDRAELFADLMFRGLKKNYMYPGFGINEKAKTMAFVLRNYFPNSTGARWERYISF